MTQTTENRFKRDKNNDGLVLLISQSKLQVIKSSAIKGKSNQEIET